MKKPDVVHLFPTYYTVKDTTKQESETYKGKADYSAREIRVNEDHHLEDQKAVILHEIVHCLLDMGGVLEHDEQVVDIMAFGILSMIRGNSDLIKWLEEVK